MKQGVIGKETGLDRKSDLESLCRARNLAGLKTAFVRILRCWLLSLLMPAGGALSSSARAGDPPRVFAEPTEGVSHAREGEKRRLILFLLVENFAPESEAILKAVNEELDSRGGEFAIVRCRQESADHRRLFQERFQQDPAKMPLGVVATADGQVVTGTNGKSPDAYRLMLRAARVQGGIETDPGKIAAIRKEIATGDPEVVSEVFGIKKGDFEPEMVALTEERSWTLRDGTTLRAALLEARGATGIFVKPDGSKVELEFERLGAADVAYLGKKLGQP